MSGIDWGVLSIFTTFIVFYGIFKSRGNLSYGNYFSSGSNTRWYTIGLSIMATQASAITFLSGPGQAYTDGMRFVQFYFGLPIAMIIIAAVFVPIYKKLNVLTAYEYLGQRFDLKTRTLGAMLFLIQRGLAAGFTIYAPALVFSSILGWNIYITNLAIGVLVIIYTVIGGTKAVAQTHKLQMIIILSGMGLAAYLIVDQLSNTVSLGEAVGIAGKMGKLNIVDWKFDPSNKYNIWTGLIGGTFLALSYFGTDQSQVQRYLGDQSIAQSRIGLLFNGIVKIPMQFGILAIGVLLFIFNSFNDHPVYANRAAVEQAIEIAHEENDQAFARRLAGASESYANTKLKLQSKMLEMKDLAGGKSEKIDVISDEAKYLENQAKIDQKEYIKLIQTKVPTAKDSDVNYLFISFVLEHFPAGIIGLLIACILFASMSSTSAELNALASTTMVDIYKRMFKREGSDAHYLKMSKWFTALWGVYAILFAFFAGQLGSLIEAVNVLGSLFYGTILGIFVVGFFIKKIKGTTVFIAGLFAEIIVCLIYFNEWMAYLWLPLVGCALVVAFALLLGIFKLDEKSGLKV